MRSQRWLAVVAAVALNAAPVLGRAADRTPFEQARISQREMQRANAYDLSRESNGLEMSANAAVTVTDVLNAMDVDPAIVITPSIMGNSRQFGVFPGLGALTPTMGANFAWISSGVAGAGTPQAVDPSGTTTEPGTNVGATCPSGTGYDCAFLTFSFQVPTGMNSVQFDFNFMSVEYPEFVNLGFNDEFAVKLTSPTYNYANIVFDMNGMPVNIDSAFFNQPCSTLAGTAFDLYSGGSCDAGATGLLHTEAPVKPGETVTLEFSIRDRGDGIYDSAALLDNFYLSTEIVDGPSTGGEVQVDWITPKSGYVAGGTQVTIHGNGFENVQAVSIGGSPALYQVLDEFTIIAVTPPHPMGPVDVAVTAQPSNNVSTGVAVNAFTYFTHPEGSPLAVLSVDPPEGPADGNVKVTVRGAGFDLDSVVTFDGEPVAAQQFINGDEIIVTTPAGGGAVEVRVTNAAGDTASLADGYLYIGSRSGNGASGGGCGCSLESSSNATPGALILLSLGLAIAAWLNRRRRKYAFLASIGIALAGCNDQTLAPVNSAPVADAGEQVEAFTGESVQLDGSDSYDFEDGTAIEFQWEIVSKPDGSLAELDDPASKTPTLVPDVSGLYRVGLTVTDTDLQTSGAIGYGGTPDDNLVDVVALPFRDMRLTLTWDTDQSDLDLHLIRDAIPVPGIVTNYWQPDYDCYYGVPDPEWGTTGIRADNPLLEQDVDTGFGPEIISLASPQDGGKYDIVAHVYNAHGAGMSNATLKLEMNGQLVAEVYSAQPLPGTDAVWVIGSILWPEGTFTEVNMQSTHQTLGGPPH